MFSISESEYNSIHGLYLNDYTLSKKIINGINSICYSINVSPIDLNLIDSNAQTIFFTCEYKLKEIVRRLDAKYPSDNDSIGPISFGKLPPLPKFRDMNVGTQLGNNPVDVGSLIGFVFGLLSCGISIIVNLIRNSKIRKRNRINNFVYIYNSLVEYI
jgi:hypothetical protein